MNQWYSIYSAFYLFVYYDQHFSSSKSKSPLKLFCHCVVVCFCLAVLHQRIVLVSGQQGSCWCHRAGLPAATCRLHHSCQDAWRRLGLTRWRREKKDDEKKDPAAKCCHYDQYIYIYIYMVFTCFYSCNCLVGIFGRTGSDYTEYPNHTFTLASLPMMACHISLLYAFDFAEHKYAVYICLYSIGNWLHWLQILPCLPTDCTAPWCWLKSRRIFRDLGLIRFAILAEDPWCHCHDRWWRDRLEGPDDRSWWRQSSEP